MSNAKSTNEWNEHLDVRIFVYALNFVYVGNHTHLSAIRE